MIQLNSRTCVWHACGQGSPPVGGRQGDLRTRLPCAVSHSVPDCSHIESLGKYHPLLLFSVFSQLHHGFLREALLVPASVIKMSQRLLCPGVLVGSSVQNRVFLSHLYLPL